MASPFFSDPFSKGWQRPVQSATGRHQPDFLLVQQHPSQCNWRLAQKMLQMRTNNQNVMAGNNNDTPSIPVVEAPSTTAASKGSASPSETEMRILKNTRGLVVLLHARSCSAHVGRCTWEYCARGRNILKHVDSCYQKQCQFPHCLEVQKSLLHFQSCKDQTCRICFSVCRILRYTDQEALSVKNSLKLGVSAKEKNHFGSSGKSAIDLNIPPHSSGTREFDLNNAPYSSGTMEIYLNNAPHSLEKQVIDLDPESPPQLPLQKKRRMKKTEIGSALSSFAKSSTIFVPNSSHPSPHRPPQPPLEKKQNVLETVEIGDFDLNRTPHQSPPPQPPLEKKQNVHERGESTDFDLNMTPHQSPSLQRSQTKILVINLDDSPECVDAASPSSHENLLPEHCTNNPNARQGVNAKINPVQQSWKASSGASDVLLGQMGYDDGGNVGTTESAQMDVDPVSLSENVNLINHECSATVKDEERSDESALRAKEERHNDGTATKVEKPSLKNVSIMDWFTSDEVRQHIVSLRQGFSQSEEPVSDSNCQLCQVGELCFEKRRIYCTPCGVPIKQNKACYMHSTNKHRYFACVQCYEKANETIQIESNTVPKAQFERKLNREECQEGWVMCDKCEKWQHQICALFNKHRNIGEPAGYICAECYLDELERGERAPLPQSAVLGAKDLCRTRLSDFLEKRLSGRLAAERQQRASFLGKSPEDIPGMEGLVIRVVSSVDKKLEVKPEFYEAFKEENYPTEFPYKSKMILLFQKIEGVEVCLFSLYVQEYGTDCALPNQRSVYIAYLDSVKYLTPDIKTVTGEPLRTFVYHEILIGYLDYCKRRGFSSCYIWAYPPVKGNDYILYCHPTTQKTLKSDKLRDWYLSMLRKGMTENIVVGLTNLYDHFFTQLGESKAKVTALRVPYFDGDYWPRAVEDVMSEQKRIRETTISERNLKAAARTNLNGRENLDTMLIKKVGRKIRQTKDNFMVVHLQYFCNHCGNLMLSGTRWVCDCCQCFCLCDGCHKTELLLEDTERHPIKNGDVHTFSPVMITGVASDTTDLDGTIERECFEYRHAFLSLCQSNMYQFDTLRRAKHSSMMVLYHLHNPTAPAFVPTCNNCTLDLEPGQEGQCDICRFSSIIMIY